MLTEKLTMVIIDNARETEKLKGTIIKFNIDINNGWQIIKGDTFNNHRVNIQNKGNLNIPLRNRFSGLNVGYYSLFHHLLGKKA